MTRISILPEVEEFLTILCGFPLQTFFHGKIMNLDYSRVEVATDARRRPMKLWLPTANGPQRSRCSKIGSPEG
ncbi:MAG: hypothetical protein GQ536_00345 [Candidatus Aminicenantes bacterium]|nr:hypothetical protein [Candidatus Aminicenantes bacterium]